jgi:hypothetical protein
MTRVRKEDRRELDVIQFLISEALGTKFAWGSPMGKA